LVPSKFSLSCKTADLGGDLLPDLRG